MLEWLLVMLPQGVRAFVAGAFVLSVIVALTHWAVRRGHLTAFGAWPRFVRRWSDPLLRPIEARIARRGGNPQEAPVWLVGITVIGGLLLIALVDWALGFFLTLMASASEGALLPTIVGLTFELLKLAVMIRVIGSWIGVGPYTRWMRPVYGMTDWLIDPIRRILPPFGLFDFSPLVAWLLLGFAETIVMRGLF